MEGTAHESGSLERREDAGKGGPGFVKLWLDAIALSGKTETKWRDQAKIAIEAFNGEKGSGSRFNILQSNTWTIAAALYNSTPVPDIRQRNDVAPPEPPAIPQPGTPPDPAAMQAFQMAVQAAEQANKDAKAISQALERTITAQHDQYDFDACMHAAVQDQLLPGRGITRVRYAPIVQDEKILDERAICEHVQWDSVRFGPAKRWEDLPWVAFQHFLTREQLEQLNPKIGANVGLDTSLEGAEDQKRDTGEQVPQLLKRATVWEIWDKETRQVIFIAKSHKDEPLAVEDDPLELEGFFPIPRPLYSIPRSWTLTPVPEFNLYKKQARELDDITVRLSALVNAARWRGIYQGNLAGAFAGLKDLDDGQFAPSDKAAQFGPEGLAKAIWTMPIADLVAVIQQLLQAREQIKAQIYEITGVSDILRGSTNASETATAQRIKAQWGSLRLQNRQTEVQRYARDLVRMQADIIASKFSPGTIKLASGVTLTESQIAMMRADINRGYRVDIETDSTIRADVESQQKNIAEAMGALGQFMQGIGPAIQTGQIKPEQAAKLMAAIMQPFKLGRQGQDALDDIIKSSEQAGKQPQQQKPDPKVEEAKAKMAIEQERLKMEGQRLELDKARMMAEDQREQAKAMADNELAKAQATRDEERHGLEMQGLQAKTAAEQQKAMLDMQGLQAEQSAKAMQAQFDHETRAAEREGKAGEASAVQALQALVVQQAEIAQQQSEAMTQVMSGLAVVVQQIGSAVASIGAPKRVVRGPDGRVEGVEPVMVN